MRRVPLVPVLCVVATLAVTACAPHTTAHPRLRAGAADVCTSSPGLVLSARADGRYALNHSVYDSAQLVTALGNTVPPRPDGVVMVRLDSAHAAALDWVIPAIERNGGTAFQFDTACVHPVHAANQFTSSAGGLSPASSVR